MFLVWVCRLGILGSTVRSYGIFVLTRFLGLVNRWLLGESAFLPKRQIISTHKIAVIIMVPFIDALLMVRCGDCA